MNITREKLNRIEACRTLYFKYDGGHHELIERDMRELGYTDFHRRVMYRRFERERCRPGWIETYGWEGGLKWQQQKIAKGQSNAGHAAPAFGENAVAPDCNADPTGVAEQVDQHDVSGRESRDHAREAACVPASELNSAPRSSEEDFDEFKAWLKTVSPNMNWEWKYQVHIYRKLKKVYDGDLKRLMIFLPPRHGKSELVTVRFTAFAMRQDPTKNVILGSYNQQLANRFSRKIRRVLTDDYFVQMNSGQTPQMDNGQRPEMDNGQLIVGNMGSVAEQAGEGMQNGQCKCTPRNSNASSNCQLSTINSPLPRPMFPFVNSRPKNTEAEWETAAGGGLRAVGAGAGITGFGADLVIIDDPVKSRAEAESKVIREKVWNWFNDDIYTRLEKDAAIILIQTRWHEDDLAGRLLRDAKEEGGEQWTVINLPAFAEQRSSAPKGQRTLARGQANRPQPWDAFRENAPTLQGSRLVEETAPLQGADLRGVNVPEAALASLADPGLMSVSPAATDEDKRVPGEALCPERFGVEALGRIREQLGSYSFSALYQQRPTPAEGGLFKRKWFEGKIITAAPSGLRWKRGTDPGINRTATSDYTASVRVAIDADGNMDIDAVFRRQVEYPELKRYILGRIAAEPGTEHGIELSANGNAIVQDIKRDRPDAYIRGIDVKADKITRSLPWLALAEAGKVFLLQGGWNDEYIEELATFPTGQHDDQVDATSIAYRMATKARKAFYVF